MDAGSALCIKNKGHGYQNCTLNFGKDNAALNALTVLLYTINTLGPRQYGHHFTDIFIFFLFDENVWISINISLKFISEGPDDNKSAFVQIMA